MIATIGAIRGREILDSRGRPTVEADVILTNGVVGRASVPSGVSVGSHEATELRDGDPSRYRGLGVRHAVENVETLLSRAIAGCDPREQAQVDERLIDADGTADRHVAGANGMLAVSLAVARAAAIATSRPLYLHVADLAGVVAPTLPLPMFNMISGGLHAGGQLDIQDVLFMPTSATSFRQALEQACALHAALGERLVQLGERRLVADEGGWAPALTRNEDAVAWVADAMVEQGIDGHIALDVAATHFYDAPTSRYRLVADGVDCDANGIVELLCDWADRFPIVSFEDGLAEDDWAGWAELTRRFDGRVQIIGDDLFTTNVARLRKGIEARVANAALIKPNQCGTLSETLDVMRAARLSGYRTVVSARSGETEDSFLADLAVGSAAGQIKVGSVTRSSRLAKWNQLLRIEEEIGSASYVGGAALRLVSVAWSPPT